MTTEEIKGIVACVAMFGIIAMIFIGAPIAIYFDHKKFKKLFESAKTKDLNWLEEEKKKPRSYVKFRLQDSREIVTKRLEPYVLRPGSEWNYARTSEQAAHQLIEDSYERDYFVGEDGRTYPACNLTEAYVVTDEK